MAMRLGLELGSTMHAENQRKQMELTANSKRGFTATNLEQRRKETRRGRQRR
jgi:hypothetical protein